MKLRYRQRAGELDRLMTELHLTSEALGKLAGYHPVTIRRYRNGTRPLIDRAWRYLRATLDQYELTREQ